MLAIAASCTVQEIDSIKGATAPEITASYENNGTKTTITTDEEGVGTIWWKPADEINVFYGTTSTHYVSKNKENATTVAFGTTDIIGSTESAQENIWGLYPYNENAVCNGESVTTTIPAAQQAIAGTFDDDIFTSLAHSTSTVMTFYNVLGGIKFSLSRDDIQTITFKGNNNEDIAGKVKLEMDANGKPAAEITEGEKTITLTPKEGTTFAKNTNYYIVMLPTVLSNGFTMTFETETEIGTFEYTAKAVEIKRSVFSKKENIDSYATFEDDVPISEMVDLGLSVKWRSYNLGASKPEEYGGYYQWGDLQDITDTNIYLDWSNCPYHTGSSYSTGWTKYITLSSYGPEDNKKVLDPEDDVAHVKLGGKWRMPTEAECRELLNNCTSEWTTLNGVYGRMFTSRKNGNSIFLPATGYRGNDYLDDAGSSGRYWSSSRDEDYTLYAYYLSFRSDDMDTYIIYRYLGQSVRPVYSEEVKATSVSLDKTELQFKIGDSAQLTASLHPSNCTDRGLTWSSNNSSVATVSSSGMVTAVGTGTADITVFWACDSGINAKCTVTVTPTMDESIIDPSEYLIYHPNQCGGFDAKYQNYRAYCSYVTPPSGDEWEIKLKLPAGVNKYDYFCSGNTSRDDYEGLMITDSNISGYSSGYAYFNVKYSDAGHQIDGTGVLTIHLSKNRCTLNGIDININKEFNGFYHLSSMFAEYYFERDEGAWLQYDGMPDGTKIYYVKVWDSKGKLIYIGHPGQVSGNNKWAWHSVSENGEQYEYASTNIPITVSVTEYGHGRD